MALDDVDLNLLKTFDVLLAERNVSAAAKRVGLSQSGMSSALRRLRELFDDPLLVRSKMGMVPTPKAESLIGPVRHILDQVSQVLTPAQPFNPASKKRWRIGVTDYVGLVVLPTLVNRLTAAAPRAHIEVLSLQDWQIPTAKLAGEELDLAINWFKRVPSSLQRRELLQDDFVCVVREQHPAVRGKITLKQYVELPHLLVAPRSGTIGVVDGALRRRGKRRHVAMTVPHFLVAPHIVVKSDLVLTLASRVAQVCTEGLPLQIMQAPIALPGFAIHMVWHTRRDRDPALHWLRQLVISACETLD